MANGKVGIRAGQRRRCAIPDLGIRKERDEALVPAWRALSKGRKPELTQLLVVGSGCRHQSFDSGVM